MGDLLGKYNIIIDGYGYVLGRNARGVKYYSKKRAPLFVSKFGSGDSSYRDATFWQFFAQTNWRNGAQQLKFDDPGKFWKSENIDTTQLEKITLSKKFSSTGQTDPGSRVNWINEWRADGSGKFGDGSDGALSISADATEAPIDSACTGSKDSVTLSATNASFAAGQDILIHQTQGTGAGNWEENEISGYTAGTITTVNPLANVYITGAQVRVVLQHSTVTIDTTKTYTAKAWNGTVGGILAWKCSGATTVAGTITATGKGFSLGGTGGGSAGDTDDDVKSLQGEGSVDGTEAYLHAANGSGGGGSNGSGADAGNGGGGGGNGTAGANGGAGQGSAGIGGAADGNVALTDMVFGGEGGGGRGEKNGAGTGGAGGAGGGIIFGKTKNITITGSIVSAGVAGGYGNSAAGGGGGGAGGSCLIKAQIATLGTAKITTAAGAAGGTDGGEGAGAGGIGGVGRIHLDYLTSYSGTTTPAIDIAQDSTLSDTPASTTSVGYAGTNTGKIYSWDEGTTWTEVYDTRRLTSYTTTADVDTAGIIGDAGGTEKALSQGFQIATTSEVKGIKVYLKKNAGTPGAITVRIETDSTAKPSGTLASASATATIPAFTTTDYGWVTVEFDTAFSLAATTTFHVVLKTAAAANDNNYAWGYNAATDGYASGNISTSVDGGSSWTAVAGDDAMFQVLSNNTSANCSLVSKIDGTKKLYVGTGDPDGSVNGDARLFSFDGTNWALVKTFNTATESAILSMVEYTADDCFYLGLSPQAKIYKSTDMSTFTLSENIDKPRNPGYPHSLIEYNRSIYAGGGSPELIPNQYYSGFIYYYDSTEWGNLYPFDFTIIKCMSFYDAYLFIGTYHGQLFVFDTASLNPIFNLKDLFDYELQITSMEFHDDKLFLTTASQEGKGDTNAGVWTYDRHGLHVSHHNSTANGYYSSGKVNNILLIGADDGYVYKVDEDLYEATGHVQSSYYDANLPSINKLYSEVELRHDPLPANCAINIYYKFKESDSWTSLGSNAVDDSESFTVTFPAGINSKKITLKYELTSSDGVSTPKITDVIMKYALWPDTKYQWNLRVLAKEKLQYRDRTTSADNAATIRSTIEASKSGTQLVTFTDIDGTDYTVLFQDIDQSVWTVDDNNLGEDLISVSLIEA